MPSVFVTDFDMITPFGIGLDKLWNGLNVGQSRIFQMTRFETRNFPAMIGALVPGLKMDPSHSMIFQLLEQIILPGQFCYENYPVIFATTKGEIDIFEQHNKTIPFSQTLGNLKKNMNLAREPHLISAACASSTIALAEASRMIHMGMAPGAVVIGVDIISEFVFSGFCSLLALSQNPAVPFDKDRNGLSLGEAACFIILRSEEEAARLKKESIGKITGWGMTNDANHPTGPSRTGDGLARAINLSLQCANKSTHEIGAICAHATGTVYNDLMEINAFKSVFKENARPVFGIKGAMGHTLGACGMIEALVVLKALNEKITPLNVNLHTVDESMTGWVSKQRRGISSDIAISTNSGFGGINASLVLSL